MAEALNLNPDEFVRGERTVSDVISQARQANPALVDKVLAAGTVKADGRIKAEAWQTLGIQGERRTPGQVLQELAQQTATRTAAQAAKKAELAQRIGGVTNYEELKAALGDSVSVSKNSDRGGVYVFVQDNATGLRVEGAGASQEAAVADLKVQLGAQPGQQTLPLATSGGVTQATVAQAGQQIPDEVLRAEERATKWQKRG